MSLSRFFAESDLYLGWLFFLFDFIFEPTMCFFVQSKIPVGIKSGNYNKVRETQE